MKQSGLGPIAERYVSALFDVAKQASAVGDVEKDLNDLARATKENEGFANLLVSPILTREQQAKLMAALADSFNTHKITKAFLGTLATQRRLLALAEIAAQFTKIAEASRGEMSAEIITATPIAKAEADQVAARLGKAYGKTVKLKTTQNTALLGGAIVKIGGMQLDASLAGKLNRLEQTLKAA